MQFFVTAAGCPTVQLNSDTVCLEMASDLTGWGLSPTRLSPPPLGASCKPRLPPVLLTNHLQIEGSNNSFGFNYFAWASHRTQGSIYLTFTSLLKYMMKDTDEQRDEEIYRVKSGRIPVSGALSPWSWGVLPSGMDVLANLEALQTPYYWHLWRVWSVIYSVSSPSPPLRGGLEIPSS